ncbi:DUF2326 domain-containing protein [Enterococcus devriesei]|uniref:DUF2326 domain-containing protein n=1 Tax=Enterococcus devriesei TaxID=319970 RepID=UPI0036D2C73C
MYLRELTISSDSQIIRRIPFHYGSNLIVDETVGITDLETGNNIGKTTVLALIDYCLGGDAETIYKDSETKKDIVYVKKFLIDKKVMVSLSIKEDLDIVDSKEIIINRNFLSRNKKVMSINGINYTKNKGKDFEKELNILIYGERESEKPSFRQLIAHNIRYKDREIENTLKYLNNFTTLIEYETLFLFMLGLPVLDRSQLNKKIKLEKEYKKRLEKEHSGTEIKFQIEIVKRTIRNLESRKSKLNINENYEQELDELNQLKLRIASISSKISDLNLRKQLLVETEDELQNEVSTLDVKELREIYSTAKKDISGIQSTFEMMVQYHNKMIIEKIRFITQDLPKLEEELNIYNASLKELLAQEKLLVQSISGSDTFQDLEKIISELTHEYEYLGELSNSLKQINDSEKVISNLGDEIELLDGGRFSDEFKNELTEKLLDFNEIFASVSTELYGEQYGITYEVREDSKTKQNFYYFECFNANTSSGKKQGEIICFDIAYILFARKNGIPHLDFLLNDKKELMHGNQLKRVSNFAKTNKIQLIFSILKDKLPTELNNKDHIVLTLSDEDKLFRIEEDNSEL